MWLFFVIRCLSLFYHRVRKHLLFLTNVSKHCQNVVYHHSRVILMTKVHFPLLLSFESIEYFNFVVSHRIWFAWLTKPGIISFYVLDDLWQFGCYSGKNDSCWQWLESRMKNLRCFSTIHLQQFEMWSLTELEMLVMDCPAMSTLLELL